MFLRSGEALSPLRNFKLQYEAVVLLWPCFLSTAQQIAVPRGKGHGDPRKDANETEIGRKQTFI